MDNFDMVKFHILIVTFIAILLCPANKNKGRHFCINYIMKIWLYILQDYYANQLIFNYTKSYEKKKWKCWHFK